MQIQLGVQNPQGVFTAQDEFLNAPRASMDGISNHHYVGGRGCAKTTTGCLLLFKTVLDMPGLRGFWSEPRHGDIEKVFLPALEHVVPRDCWQLVNKQGYRYVQWWNGHRTDLVARNVDNSNKKIGLGPNYSYGINDEAADRFDINKFIDMANAIRDPRAPYYYMDSLSTPQMNGYYSYCHLPHARIIHATSYDNPFIPAANIDSMKAAMAPEIVQQEILGEWCMLTGRMWPNFVEEPWPNGNIMEGMEFDPCKPFVLACDLGGAQGAYQIVQYMEPNEGGRRHLSGGRVAVVVAELVPNNMNLESVLDEVINVYCGGDAFKRRPVKVCVGSDVVTPGNAGTPAALAFKQLGWETMTPKGWLASKDIQRQCASSLMLNTAGERRFAVAAKKDKHGIYQIARQHFGERKQRGIMHMLRNDTFPKPESRDIFVKDKSVAGANALEDDRDCMLYWMVLQHPPVWAATTKRAAG